MAMPSRRAGSNSNSRTAASALWSKRSPPDSATVLSLTWPDSSMVNVNVTATGSSGDSPSGTIASCAWRSRGGVTLAALSAGALGGAACAKARDAHSTTELTTANRNTRRLKGTPLPSAAGRWSAGVVSWARKIAFAGSNDSRLRAWLGFAAQCPVHSGSFNAPRRNASPVPRACSAPDWRLRAASVAVLGRPKLAQYGGWANPNQAVPFLGPESPDVGIRHRAPRGTQPGRRRLPRDELFFDDALGVHGLELELRSTGPQAPQTRLVPDAVG